jgi:hypothetical protein
VRARARTDFCVLGDDICLYWELCLELSWEFYPKRKETVCDLDEVSLAFFHSVGCLTIASFKKSPSSSDNPSSSALTIAEAKQSTSDLSTETRILCMKI